MINGAIKKQLKKIPDERGFLMEMLRSDEDLFQKFGQIYLTTAYPGVVKACHYHRIQTDHFVVIKGMMKVVLYDDREDSPTRGEVNEFFMGDQNQMLLVIPQMVWHGFKCISEDMAYVVNIPTELYNYKEPDEYRVNPHNNDIPYDWGRRDG